MGRRAVELSECHPYGVARLGGADPVVVARCDDQVLDLAAASVGGPWQDLLSARSLDPLLAAGPGVWAEVRGQVATWADGGDHRTAVADAQLLLPFTVADYVDFYSSEHHARHLGAMLRPGQPPLQPNWFHQPVGYHGRSGTVVVSGTDVVRPHGHVLVDGTPRMQPSARLDVEVEVGYVVGTGSPMGRRVAVDAFAEHVFGIVLVNDWSARDIQAFEAAPLGPFVGKSFQTSMSPWVVPLAALEAARGWPPSHDTDLSSYLVETQPWGLDLDLELAVNGEVVSRPPYRVMHWSGAQLVAHLTVGGASLRTGDLYASGTVSGPEPDTVGSLIEAWRGERFLADGDEVRISGAAAATDGSRLDLGEVRGVVSASRSV